jgi:hypothetical protein
VPLPEPTEGTISKVLFFPAPDGSADFWLSILYSSGVELHVTTAQHDLDAFAKRVSVVEFRDGADHLVRETIGGRDVVIVRGGVQSGLADGHVVRPVAIWNESGLAYTLYLPDQEAGDVQHLEAIVSSVR